MPITAFGAETAQDLHFAQIACHIHALTAPSCKRWQEFHAHGNLFYVGFGCWNDFFRV